MAPGTHRIAITAPMLSRGSVSAPVNGRFGFTVPPTQHRLKLNNQLHQNWLAKHGHEATCGGMTLDDSLTSLNWLQNLNILKITSPTPPASPSPVDISRSIKREASSSPPPMTAQCKLEPRLQVADMAPSCGTSFHGHDSVDYKTNPYVKPPYSYATLICMAMRETKKNKITLSSIYNWITDNFMYYRMADPSWQNSIRHNLSLNKCFKKVARNKDEPGKGGFWSINPEYGEMIENGVFKKRRGSRDVAPTPPLKRFKLEDEDAAAVNGLKSSTREDKLLSNGSFGDFGLADDDDDDSLTLRGDFNWTNLLSQDIEVGGIRVKTETILDDSEPSPLTAMSPPSSETNSDDLGLDDLFSQTDFADMNLAVDFTTNDPLDLTLHGTHIRPPEWWNTSDGLSDLVSDDIQNNNFTTGKNVNSGLNTPVPPSPKSDEGGDTLWSDTYSLDTHNDSAFDLDNLFDIDIQNIPSPNML